MAGGIFSSGANIFTNWASNELAANTDIKAMNQYMSQWGSPEAQMKSFRDAGINPYFAAQQISGNSGSTNVSSSSVSDDFASNVSNMQGAQSLSQKTPAEVKNIEADTEGKNIENQFNKDTLEDRKNVVKEELRKLGYDADTAESVARYADDIQKWTLKDLKSQVHKRKSEVDLIDKQIDLMDKQISEIDQNIKVLKQQVKTMISQEDLNRANESLVKLEQQKLGLEIDKQKIENKKFEYDTNDPVATYNYILDTKGEEAADTWYYDAKSKIGEVERKISQSRTEGVNKGNIDTNPEIKTQKETKDYWDEVIDEYDRDISLTEKVLKDPNLDWGTRMSLEADLAMTKLEKRRAVRKRAQQVPGSGSIGIKAGPVGFTD
jgi:hypothetical protein